NNVEGDIVIRRLDTLEFLRRFEIVKNAHVLAFFRRRKSCQQHDNRQRNCGRNSTAHGGLQSVSDYYTSPTPQNKEDWSFIPIFGYSVGSLDAAAGDFIEQHGRVRS